MNTNPEGTIAMDDQQAVYSAFQLDVLKRLSSIEQTLGVIHSGFDKLTSFAETTTTKLVSMEVECVHHRKHTAQIAADMGEVEDRLRKYDQTIDQVAGGWKATTALAAFITVAANAIWIAIHRILTGKS